MDSTEKTLFNLFDAQRYFNNARLQKQIDEVHARYLSNSQALDDEELEVFAAGEIENMLKRPDDGGSASK